MKKKNHLIIISAPSGAGKTTLSKKLLEDFAWIKQSISSTTRAPRGSEQNGVDYFFLDHSTFEEEIRKGGFAEWAKVHGHYYGTSKSVIEEALRSHYSLLLVIDVQGAKQLREAFNKDCFTIFIAPPSLETLEERLKARGTDSETVIQKRLLNAKTEMSESQNFDAIIVNDSLEQAYTELKNVLKKRLHLQPKETLES